MPLLFPELAALAYGVFTNPAGPWAKAPVHLLLTPVLTAFIGTLLARHFGFGVIPVALSVASSILSLALLRSPITPAISAGLLPIVLTIHSYAYPLSVALAVTLLIATNAILNGDERGGQLASPQWRRKALGAYGLFILALALAAAFSGWRLILFPPLAVLAFDRMVLGANHLWRGRIPVLLLAGGLNASAAALLLNLLGNTPLTVAAGVAAGILLLRLLRFHAAPVLAIGLLPFVTGQGDGRAVGAIMLGLLALYGAAALQTLTRPILSEAEP
ncbi:MAG: hypothetical protein KGL65_01765 [Rhodospirillales bacterium]|nr:hypothetical protein [Rhodospirillales bacterium]